MLLLLLLATWQATRRLARQLLLLLGCRQHEAAHGPCLIGGHQGCSWCHLLRLLQLSLRLASCEEEPPQLVGGANGEFGSRLEVGG